MVVSFIQSFSCSTPHQLVGMTCRAPLTMLLLHTLQLDSRMIEARACMSHQPERNTFKHLNDVRRQSNITSTATEVYTCLRTTIRTTLELISSHQSSHEFKTTPFQYVYTAFHGWHLGLSDTKSQGKQNTYINECLNYSSRSIT